MMRWIAGLILLIVVSLVVLYMWVPSHVVVLKTRWVRGNAPGTARFLAKEKSWEQLDTADPYRIGRRLSQVVEVMIPRGADSPLSSWVSVIPTRAADTVEIQWQLNIASGSNPFVRIGRYRMAQAIGRKMANGLERITDSLGDERIYGIPISQVMTTDSFLLISRTELPAEPSVRQLYSMFDGLRAWGRHNGVVHTGYPMVNVTPLATDRFQVETALPIDRPVPAKDGIIFRKMVRGQFLVSEVQGGPGRVREAFSELNNYVMDHQRTVMAIPFQSLVTDRLQEPDSSKWITRLYYPIY